MCDLDPNYKSYKDQKHFFFSLIQYEDGPFTFESIYEKGLTYIDEPTEDTPEALRHVLNCLMENNLITSSNSVYSLTPSNELFSIAN